MPPTARGRPSGGGASGAAARGLRLMAVTFGVFLVFSGIDKLPWLTDSSLLSQRFDDWLEDATPFGRWYIETLAIPGAPLFARLAPIAEVAAGAALIVGFWMRLAATLAFVIALNFHLASGSFAEWAFLRDGMGLPVLGGLLALAIGGSKLPFSVST